MLAPTANANDSSPSNMVIRAFLLLVTCIQVTCIQAAQLSDNPIPIATNYRAFGPLPYVTDRGSNPLHSLHTPLLQTLQSLKSFPSESAVGGSAAWRDCPSNASSPHIITCPFSDADPNLPYQAWATANFSVHQTNPYPLLQCSDQAFIQPISLLRNASEPAQHTSLRVIECPPDLYNDARSLCPISLSAGTYRIFVTTASNHNHTRFQCNLYPRAEDQTNIPLLPIQDLVTPDVVVTENPFSAALAGNHISVTLQNLHTTQWATAGAARLIQPPIGIRLAPHATSDSHFPLPRIAPRQIRQLRIDLLTDSDFLASSTPLPENLQLIVAVSYRFVPAASHEIQFNLTLDVTTWRKSRSYHFTYVDVDASIQAAAVLPPKNPCIGAPAGGDACPVLLSTHGAGVDAVGHAWTDSYKTQNQSWVLLPTGRRKYGLNWEGPQLKTAITALNVLAEKLPGVPTAQADMWRARADMWLQAGHSMGGHGALLLATHFPDMLLAALPAMGWLRLSSYGGVHYDEQLSYSDAAARSLLTIASAEYSADLYAENLLGIPFLARVGSEDQNVPPSKLRKFCRLLKENEYFRNFKTSFVKLNEVPGEGHWFDGVVDDDLLQKFIQERLAAVAKPRLPSQFSLFTVNPASTGSRGGLSILSLEVPFQASRLQVIRDVPESGTWQVMTENVRRFRYMPVPGLLDRPERLLIDRSEEPVPVDWAALEKSGKYLDFCVHPASGSRANVKADVRDVTWRSCRDMSVWGTPKSPERGPESSGPSFQVLAERKVVLVYPEGDTELLDAAVLYANSLYVRGISVQVTPDSEVSIGQLTSADDSNVILLGGPGMNRMASKYYEDGHSADVTFGKNEFCIAGTKCYTQPGTGIAFLSRGRERTLVFYVAGTDREGVLEASSFLPRSPASNVPEWVIVSKRKGWGFRGLGGVIGLGYWDYEWRLEPRKSYPSEFVLEAKQRGMTCGVTRGGSSLFGSPALLVGILLFICLVLVTWRFWRRGTARYEQVAKQEPHNTRAEEVRLGEQREKATLLQDQGVGVP